MNDYTKTKLKQLRTENNELKKAMKEIQTLVDVILANVILEYGKDEQIILHNINVEETLKRYRVHADKEEENYMITLEEFGEKPEE